MDILHIALVTIALAATGCSILLFLRDRSKHDDSPPAGKQTEPNVPTGLGVYDRQSLNALLLENVHAVMALVDYEGKFLFVNHAGARSLNTTPEQITGRTQWELFDRKSADKHMAAIRQVIDSGQGFTGKDPIEFPNGTRWFFTDLRPFRNPDGEVRAAIVISYDVTDLEQASESLRQERNMFVEGPVVVFKWAMGEGWPVEYVSPNVKDVLGYSAQEFLSGEVSFASIVPDSDAPRSLGSTGNSDDQSTTDLRKPPYRAVRKDGSEIWLAEYTAFHKDSNGRATHCLGYLLDVTDRKRATDALSDSEKQYRTLLENLPFGVFRSTPEGKAVSVNPAMVQLYGFDSEEEMLEAFAVEGYTDPRDRTELLERLKDEGTIRDIEVHIRRKDGSRVWIESSMRASFDDNGLIEYFDGIDVDITDRKKAEEALRDSEAKYRSIMEQSGDNIYLMDLQTKKVIEANEAMCRFVGYSADELQGMHVYDFINHEPSDIDNKIARVINEKRYYVGERQYRCKDGTVADVEVSVSYLELVNRPMLCIISRDISERKKAENVLRESEERLRRIADTIPVPVAISRLSDGKVLFANSLLCETFGYTHEQVKEMSTIQFYDSSDDRIAAITQLRDAENVQNFELPGVRSDGTKFWAHLSLHAINYKGEEAVFGGFVDISERKSVEESLRYRLEIENLVASISKRFLRTPTDKIDESIYLSLREVGNFVAADRSSVFRFSDDLSKMMCTHEWAARGVRKQNTNFGEMATSKFPWWIEKLQTEDYVYFPDMSKLPSEAGVVKEELVDKRKTRSMVSVPMLVGKRLVGFIGWVTSRKAVRWKPEDITLLRLVAEIVVNAMERKRHEDLIRKANEEKILQAKQIAGGFAHEIRNALFPARGVMDRFLLDHVHEGTTGQGDSDMYSVIDASITRAMDVVEHVRKYTKLDSEYMPDNVSVHDTVTSIVKDNHDLLERNHVEVDYKGPKDAMVVCNKQQLYMVINNLLLNAVNATEDSTRPAIRIEWSTKARSVKLSVADNGRGIEESHRDRVFEAFFSTSPDSGTGVGLAIVKKVVDMYGGSISVTSSPGQGARFDLEFVSPKAAK